MIESIEKQSDGLFKIQVQLQYTDAKRIRFFVYDKDGDALKPQKRGGGSGSSWSHSHFSVDRLPAKLVVTLGNKQPLRVDIPVKNIPLRLDKQQPIQLRQPKFGNHDEPVTLTVFAAVRDPNPRRPQPPSQSVQIQNLLTLHWQ